MLVHVPPVLGNNVVVAPIQISVLPNIETAGFGSTTTGADWLERQPVLLNVNINLALPA